MVRGIGITLQGHCMAASGAGGAGRSGILRALSLLDSTIGAIEKGIVGGAVLLMAAVMSGHVLGRVLFGQGIPGTSEIAELLIIIMTFIGVSYGVRSARHISMSAIYDQLQGTARKAMLVTICLVTALLMFYFAWLAWDYTSTIYARGRVSGALTIPLWTVYIAAPVGFALAGIQYLLTAVRNLTSREIYRSFTEKEEYAAVPAEGNGTTEAGAERRG